MPCEACEHLELGEKRNSIASVAAGAFVSILSATIVAIATAVILAITVAGTAVASTTNTTAAMASADNIAITVGAVGCFYWLLLLVAAIGYCCYYF